MTFALNCRNGMIDCSENVMHVSELHMSQVSESINSWKLNRFQLVIDKLTLMNKLFFFVRNKSTHNLSNFKFSFNLESYAAWQQNIFIHETSGKIFSHSYYWKLPTNPFLTTTHKVWHLIFGRYHRVFNQDFSKRLVAILAFYTWNCSLCIVDQFLTSS